MLDEFSCKNVDALSIQSVLGVLWCTFASFAPKHTFQTGDVTPSLIMLSV